MAGLHVDFGLRIDPLSLTFVLLITGVGGLIHIYAVGYMAPHGDPHSETGDPSARRRFFAQFNLFITAMLLLVLGNNFVLLYLGWEGVGLASYLLIGFYQGRPSAATAAKKAFLMNRVGDVGLAHRDLHPVDAARHAAVHRGVRERRADRPERARRDHAAAAARRLRQVRPVPAAGVAPGRDGGPHTGLRAHPRGNDGHRGRLPRRPHEPALRPDGDGPGRRRDHRHDHPAHRRDHRLRLRRHQEGAGLLHGQPDRLHVPRGGARSVRLRARHRAPAGPRLLQGGPVPRGGLGHARDERQRRHAPLRRACGGSCRSRSSRSGWVTSP